MSYQSRFTKIINKYGQDVILYRHTDGERCPGYDESTGYCDPQYHRDNPDEPQCNEDSYINTSATQTPYKAFIQPLRALSKREPELYNTLIGKAKDDDYVYMGPSSIDIRNLLETDYLVYDGREFIITNPDENMISNQIIFYFGTLELR